MTLDELKEAIERHLKFHPREGAIKVVVALNEPSVGGRATSEVETAFAGFDWERGKFILSAEHKLHLRTDFDQIQKLRKDLDSLAWENHTLKGEVKRLKRSVSQAEPAK